MTFVPFTTRTLIKGITVSEPGLGVASAGLVNVQIANADRGPAFGYELYLEARDVTEPGSSWTYVASCPRPRLACAVDYLAAPHDAEGGPRTIKFRPRSATPVRCVIAVPFARSGCFMAWISMP